MQEFKNKPWASQTVVGLLYLVNIFIRISVNVTVLCRMQMLSVLPFLLFTILSILVIIIDAWS
jgi:hypothetical protein